MNRTIKKGLILAFVAMLSSACTENLTVPNLNSPARVDLTGNPTRATIAAAVRGVVATQRGLKAGMVARLGVWGREGYDLRPEEPRTITDALIDPIDPVNGGLYFGGQFTQIAGINTVLTALESTDVFTDPEKAAIRGFVNTLKAEAFWQMIIARADGVGIPLDPNSDPQGELSTISAPAAVYDFIFNLYDSALTDLQAGGGEFPFTLPSGFGAYNDPSSFTQVNRALKARALKYQGRWADVITALTGSFLDTNASLDEGVYYNYSTISGDATNPHFSVVSQFAHPRILADAQLQADASPDQRAQDKTEPGDPFTLLDITASEDLTVYNSLSDPFPSITNDELILMRAEANLALGNTPEALADVNVIRTGAGNLPALTDLGADPIGEIIYNRLYSLLWEGGFHYYDMRQYDRLDQLPRALPNHGVYPGFPYPQNECLARDIMTQVECTTYFAS